jgi:hypothetical protein
MSGPRLWGWERDRFGTPDRFFALLRDKLLFTLLRRVSQKTRRLKRGNRLAGAGVPPAWRKSNE